MPSTSLFLREKEYIKSLQDKDYEDKLVGRIKENIAKISTLQSNPQICLLVDILAKVESTSEFDFFYDILTNALELSKESDSLRLDYLFYTLKNFINFPEYQKTNKFPNKKREDLQFAKCKADVNRSMDYTLENMEQSLYLFERQKTYLRKKINNLVEQEKSEKVINQLQKCFYALDVFEKAISKLTNKSE
jgi:hypothetical protein